MDAKLFRLPTKPNFYAAISTADPFDLNQKQKYSQLPTEDSRFPGWAAPMSDGRLVTSYQNHCSQNIPAGKQYPTKGWMTRNATEIIQLGRERAANQTGSIYGLDDTVVPPPVAIVSCTRSDCRRAATHAKGGFGTERVEEIPHLFGTWDARAVTVSKEPRTGITTVYEGGRNTPRGGQMV